MFKILSIILKKKKYAFIAAISSLLIGAISYYLTVVNISSKSILIFIEMSGPAFAFSSLLLSLAIALLLGVYVALLVFRRDIVRAKAMGNKLTGGIGGTVGIIATGCPACGAPLLGLIGLPLGLFSLPFKGLELKIISIIFLLLSIYLINKNVKNNLVCKVESHQRTAKTGSN